MSFNQGRPTLDATWDHWAMDMEHEVGIARNTSAVRVLSAAEVNRLLAVGAITPVEQIGTEHKHRPIVFGHYLRGDDKPVAQGQVA